MSADFKKLVIGFAFILLTIWLFILSFPIKAAFDSANIYAKQNANISLQSDNYFELGIFAHLSNIDIIKSNAQIATVKNIEVLNFGIICIAYISDISPSQNVLDFSITNALVLYSPIFATKAYITANGNFGSLSAYVAKNQTQIFISPSDGLRNFKQTPFGAKILSDIKGDKEEWEVKYEY